MSPRHSKLHTMHLLCMAALLGLGMTFLSGCGTKAIAPSPGGTDSGTPAATGGTTASTTPGAFAKLSIPRGMVQSGVTLKLSGTLAQGTTKVAAPDIAITSDSQSLALTFPAVKAGVWWLTVQVVDITDSKNPFVSYEGQQQVDITPGSPTTFSTSVTAKPMLVKWDFCLGGLAPASLALVNGGEVKVYDILGNELVTPASPIALDWTAASKTLTTPRAGPTAIVAGTYQAQLFAFKAATVTTPSVPEWNSVMLTFSGRPGQTVTPFQMAGTAPDLTPTIGVLAQPNAPGGLNLSSVGVFPSTASDAVPTAGVPIAFPGVSEIVSLAHPADGGYVLSRQAITGSVAGMWQAVAHYDKAGVLAPTDVQPGILEASQAGSPGADVHYTAVVPVPPAGETDRYCVVSFVVRSGAPVYSAASPVVSVLGP